MKGSEAIVGSLQSTHEILTMYLADFSDADLLVRPVPSANHTAWQLGHLIEAERHMVNMGIPDAKFPALPPGFAEKHTKATAGKDDPAAFFTKAEYLDLFQKFRETSIATAAKLSDADLDKPTTGPMAQFAPTVGAILLAVANHTMMHAGQFTVARRKMGKPILF
jgi:uncharacterized damage-inducible protein DinB